MLKIGDIVLEMPPKEGNPRNSEGAFIDLKDGSIAFMYSHFIGDTSKDAAPAAIAKCVSSDGGKTWSKREIIIMPK
jgi:sialidase-1